MRKLLIGTRGRSVVISVGTAGAVWRGVTAAQARRYAALLVAAAEVAEKTKAPPVDASDQTHGGSGR